MAAFYLNNEKTKRELNFYNSDRLLPFCPTPTCFVIELDRSLTFRHYLVPLRKNYLRASRQLVGSGSGAGAETLLANTLSLIHTTTEYCAPVFILAA